MAQESTEYWSLERCKRAYLDYLEVKTDEIQEQKNARRYRHGAQWTAEQIRALNKRKQPVVTYNRIGRKINGVIGLVEKLKQAPKAYPRTMQEQERGGADLATAVVRAVLDAAEWKAKSPLCAEKGAVDGIGGVELVLEEGDMGDPDIGLNIVDPESFFYDPRSFELDFSDARFMGMGKWVDEDTAIELMPDKEEEIKASVESGADLTSEPDREDKWFDSTRDVKRLRMVDIWYKHKGGWCWCVFTGSTKLMEGKSYFKNEKGKPTCKYIMFSGNVDHEGDRYGLVRDLIGPQDEINQRRSKGIFSINVRRMKAERGAFDDVERARIEAARPDGVVEYRKGFEVEFDDSIRLADAKANLEMLQEAKDEIENFGPNPAIMGQGVENQSGRAISLLQQAGIAELGPFILSLRGWKIRLYRAIFTAVQEHWQSERFIRVTDDEDVAQFVGINQLKVDPMTGLPTMVNAIGNLDVDIIMDEGPDSLNMMADTYDALLAIAQNGAQIPPDVLIELAPGIDSDTRKRILERLQQPNPEQQKRSQIEERNAMAEIAETEASAGLKQAQAYKTVQEASRPDQGPSEHPMKEVADIRNTNAKTRLTEAQTLETMQDIALRPREMEYDRLRDMARENSSARNDM